LISNCYYHLWTWTNLPCAYFINDTCLDDDVVTHGNHSLIGLPSPIVAVTPTLSRNCSVLPVDSEKLPRSNDRPNTRKPNLLYRVPVPFFGVVHHRYRHHHRHHRRLSTSVQRHRRLQQHGSFLFLLFIYYSNLLSVFISYSPLASTHFVPNYLFCCF